MFKANFIKLCNQAGQSPSAVCRRIGLSNAAYSCWTEDSVPRQATLQKIADYFGVTPASLLTPTTNAATNAPNLSNDGWTPEEMAVIKAYRANPALQAAVRKLLDVPPSEGVPSSSDTIQVPQAAHSQDHAPAATETYPTEQAESFTTAPCVETDF